MINSFEKYVHRKIFDWIVHLTHHQKLKSSQNWFVSLVSGYRYGLRKLQVPGIFDFDRSLDYQRVVHVSTPQTSVVQFSDSETLVSVTIPTSYVADLSDSLTCVGSDICINKDSAWIPSYEIDDDLFDDSLIAYSSDNLALVNQFPCIRIDDAIIIHSLSSANWYHWTIECLSQIVMARINTLSFKFVVVDEEIQKSKNHIDVLQRVLPEMPTKILYVNRSTCVYGLRSFAIFGVHKVPFNILGGFPRKDCLAYRSDVLLELRTLLLSSVPLILETPKRVFLLRRDGRRDYNQEQVLTLFKTIGFTGIYCESMSFDEQVQVFANAEIIVGPTGAAWTNLLFVSESTKCFCWAPESMKHYSCFSSLASFGNATMSYYFYEDNAKTMRDLYSKSYSVDAKDLFNTFNYEYPEV